MSLLEGDSVGLRTVHSICKMQRAFVRSMSGFTIGGISLAEKQALIGGEWLASCASGKYDVENPASGQVIAQMAKCGKDETNQAIAAASEAFKTWSRRPAKDRAAVLMRWHDECVAARDDITRIMTQECGKPLAEARNEFDSGVESLRFFAAEATRALGDYIPADDSRDFVVIKQPVGVVGAISPWYALLRTFYATSHLTLIFLTIIKECLKISQL